MLGCWDFVGLLHSSWIDGGVVVSGWRGEGRPLICLLDQQLNIYNKKIGATHLEISSKRLGLPRRLASLLEERKCRAEGLVGGYAFRVRE